MMMTAQTRIGTPIVPRNKADPTQSSRQVSRMFNDIEDRYLNIKRRLKALFDLRLTGQQREANAQQSPDDVQQRGRRTFAVSSQCR